MSSSRFDRRKFMVAGTAGLTTLAIDTAAAENIDQPQAEVRVCVLEHADRWTEKSTGLTPLLSSAGCKVAPLQVDRSPLEQPNRPQLIVFGSFTNNDEPYGAYVEQFTAELQQFVAAGGVVLEMTQSDQFGNTVKYLPKGMNAKRGDRDLTSVFALAIDHPLVSSWWPDGATQVGTDFFHRNDPNWESFDEWSGMQVVLASEADGRSPCLLEGAFGKGRFLVSSLWLDKCYRPDGTPTYGKAAIDASERFFAAVTDHVRAVTAGTAPSVVVTPLPPSPPAGPMVGHVDTESARIWFRPSDDQRHITTWQCSVQSSDGRTVTATKTPDADHDFTLLFDVDGLEPATEYQYEITPITDGSEVETFGPFKFSTDTMAGTPTKMVLSMGSCAPSDPNYVWTRIVDEGCEGFIFLGDTPYVDSGDLKVAREKHRRFLSQPEIAKMVANMPCWGTWDDHDFGRNDGHGDFPGKHVCRTAFTEYRANREFGHRADGALQTDPFGDGRGVYTSFRRGPLEVFLIDPRWFSRTEPSWADPSQTTCIGKVQWEWLKQGLTSSTATFKALATGMIWDDKTNSEKDDWHTYRYERDAIYDFIRNQAIPGCFLIGGDIHVSRALNYGPRVGYDLWQFIVSPLHAGVIPELDVPHPNLVHHAQEPHVFLRIEIDTHLSPATLKAEWINRDGERMFTVNLDSDQLTPTV
ncbi:alkaline phosphatase D family protein [Aeoliella mucimassa]|uniref:Alkaline phosphatase D n=1 Tax=Aeoliella mucimassa TaxID=2527972 RepID=A0A518AJY6_9BACT|nr:alkaline phosphatase D family protein [Aeoliella mucimassa]QDU55040.1 Alkaline phosphatase D precursor [Aeoliella mucimassa]